MTSKNDALTDLSWPRHVSESDGTRRDGSTSNMRRCTPGDHIGGTFRRGYSASLVELLKPLGHCGVRVKEGVEVVAEQAVIGHHEGGTVLTDLLWVNAFKLVKK